MGGDTLPGGAKLIAKAARKVGGWRVGHTTATIARPVKVTAAKEAPDGRAVYEDVLATRVHFKGQHLDGRRFAVRYIDGQADAAYVWSARTLDGATWSDFVETNVTGVKAYISEVPSEVSD